MKYSKLLLLFSLCMFCNCSVYALKSKSEKSWAMSSFSHNIDTMEDSYGSCQFSVYSYNMGEGYYRFHTLFSTDLQPTGWILPDGSEVLGDTLEYTFTEVGSYTICAYHESEECGTLQSCATVHITDFTLCVLTHYTFTAEFTEEANRVFTYILQEEDSIHLSGGIEALGGTFFICNMGYCTSPGCYQYIFNFEDDFAEGMISAEMTIHTASDTLYHSTLSVNEEFPVATFSLNADCQTNIAEYEMSDKLYIYPNPMRDEATVVLGEDLWKIYIHDLSGRLIYSFHEVTGSFRLSDKKITPGCYVINAKSNLAARSTRLLVVE